MTPEERKLAFAKAVDALSVQMGVRVALDLAVEQDGESLRVKPVIRLEIVEPLEGGLSEVIAQAETDANPG
jgi:hypothetical protein